MVGEPLAASLDRDRLDVEREVGRLHVVVVDVVDRGQVVRSRRPPDRQLGLLHHRIILGRRHGGQLVWMDRIQLEGMVFSGRHGVRPAERAEPQEFKVDVKVDADLAAPGRSDRVEDTVDYRPIYAIAKGVIEGESGQAHRNAGAADRRARARAATESRRVSVRVAKRPQSMRPIDAAAVMIKRTRA